MRSMSPLAPGRHHHGADELIAARLDLRRSISPTNIRGWSFALATRLLDADDEYCRARGLIIAADDVPRDDLEAVLGAALTALACADHGPPGDLDCPRCQIMARLQRVLSRLARPTPGGSWRA